MSLVKKCKVYLDITDNDRDAKIAQLLSAGYSSMTKTADVLPVTGFDPNSDTLQLDPLFEIVLFTYVTKELETDPDRHAKLEAIYERQANALAMSSAFGDFTALEG